MTKLCHLINNMINIYGKPFYVKSLLIFNRPPVIFSRESAVLQHTPRCFLQVPLLFYSRSPAVIVAGDVLYKQISTKLPFAIVLPTGWKMITKFSNLWINLEIFADLLV